MAHDHKDNKSSLKFSLVLHSGFSTDTEWLVGVNRLVATPWTLKSIDRYIVFPRLASDCHIQLRQDEIIKLLASKRLISFPAMALVTLSSRFDRQRSL